MDNGTIGKAYATFAPLYDMVFGPILAPGRRSAVRCMKLNPGEHVLEVGVGTGLSLPYYPRDVRVTGIDLAPEMLEKAKARTKRKSLQNVMDLRSMDAMNMQFPDHTFDAVIAMYMISVVPNPLGVVREMHRVCKPGGHVIIVNHFRTRSAFLRAMETVLKPIHHLIRFRADLDRDRFVDDAGLRIEDAFKVNILGYSTVLRCRNAEPATETPASPSRHP